MQYLVNVAAVAALGSLALAGATAPARAQTTFSSGGTVSERVSYRDLNINEEAGAKVLMGRIRHAARDVCGPPESGDPLGRGRVYAMCVRATVTRAIADLNNPVVTALANPEHGNRGTTLATLGR